MGFTELLTHTADVYRESESRVDRFNQPVEGDPWRTYPCRLTAPKGGERFEERSRDVIQAKHEVFFEAGADVKESDEVTVKNGTGRALVERANVVLVRVVHGRTGDEHHLEAFLDTVRGPQA